MKSLIALMGITMFLLSGCTQESVSLGVIGGADGPTAIFVSAAPFWCVLPLIIAAVIADAAIMIVRRKKKG